MSTTENKVDPFRHLELLREVERCSCVSWSFRQVPFHEINTFAYSEPLLHQDRIVATALLRERFGKIKIKSQPVSGPTDDYYRVIIVNLATIARRGERVAEKMGII